MMHIATDAVIDATSNGRNHCQCQWPPNTTRQVLGLLQTVKATTIEVSHNHPVLMIHLRKRARTASSLCAHTSWQKLATIDCSACRQYHRSERPWRKRSSKSPMTDSLLGLQPKCRSNHVATLGGWFLFMPSLPAVPAILATASPMTAASPVLPSSLWRSHKSISWPVHHAPALVLPARK